MTMLPAPATGCRLLAPDGRALPLRAVDLATDAATGLARVTLRQTFANPFAEPLRVTYLLPLPADGAVVSFAFTVAGQRFQGVVQRREDARRTFERAVLEGRTAALLEQDRSSLFTQELGNVPPGGVVEVELEVEQPLAWVDGGWEWRFPTVVGPRYLGAAGRVPDAERVVVDVAPEVPVQARALIRLGDAPTGAPTSPSHTVWNGDGGVQLVGGLDRDLVLRWPVAAPAPGIGLETARRVGDEDAHALLTLVPPSFAPTVVRRDLCLLLDTSGSMGGRPLDQLRAVSAALVSRLRDGDGLEMIEFSSRPTRWQPRSVRVDARTRAEALAWLAALRASGGTEMHTAVGEALAPLSAEAQRQVVLMTDGYIGFEAEVIGRIVRHLPGGSRIHVVGVGSSVNRTLTAGVARAGGGVEVVVGPDEPVDLAVAELLARTGDPVWVDVRVGGSAVREVAPAAGRDLYGGCPARYALRLRPEGGELVIRARTALTVVERRVPIAPIPEGHGRAVVCTRFARERVEDLETAVAGGADAAAADAAIEAIGLRYQLATRRTSWVAVSGRPTVDPADPTRRVVQPHTLPYGVSAEGVGLGGPAEGGEVLLQESVTELAKADDAAPRKKEKAAEPRRARSESAPRPASPVRLSAPEPLSAPESRRQAAPGGAAAPSASPAAPPPPPKAAVAPLVGRVVSREGGRWVIEITLDADADWDPSSVVADGGRSLLPLAGTTRAGRVAAGATVRLVLEAVGAEPTTLTVGGRQVRVA